MAKQICPQDRMDHKKLRGLRWIAESPRIARGAAFCQGHVVYRAEAHSWLGIIAQGPGPYPTQRHWIVYQGKSPILAASEVSQRLYQRTLNGYQPLDQAPNTYNLLSGIDLEQQLLEQLEEKDPTVHVAQIVGSGK